MLEDECPGVGHGHHRVGTGAQARSRRERLFVRVRMRMRAQVLISSLVRKMSTMVAGVMGSVPVAFLVRMKVLTCGAALQLRVHCLHGG